VDDARRRRLAALPVKGMLAALPVKYMLAALPLAAGAW
jgi:hypothetical protein